MKKPALLPPPSLIAPRRTGPVILSVPHSGRTIGSDLARRVHGGAKAIEALSDPYIDTLVEPMIDNGFGAVVAQTPRAVIDVNRAADALDPTIHENAPPASPESRQARGLGIVIGRRVDGKPLWKERLSQGEFATWLSSAWQPYHDALAAMLDQTRARCGLAVLVDCHSMPPLGRGKPQIVLGDRHGQSAGDWVAATAKSVLGDMGIEPGHNVPYAGGEIAAAHGKPDSGVHVLQVELDRRLYLDAALKRPGSGMTRTRAILSAIVRELEEAAGGRSLEAAE